MPFVRALAGSLVAGTLVSTAPALAAPELPGCTKTPVDMTLQTPPAAAGHGTLMAVTNTSDEQIILTPAPDTEKDPGAQAGWTTGIDAGKVTVLYAAHDALVPMFACMGPKDQVRLDCAEKLAACAVIVPQPKGEAGGGAYWAAENVAPNQVAPALAKRGFKPGR